MSHLNQNTAAIILSGGAGTRLNGVDKGLQHYQGKALIAHVIATIEPQVDSIYICANRNLKSYRELGFKVCEDEHQYYHGPMAGISAALKQATLESNIDQVLVSSCDAPNLPIDLRERLESSLAETNHSDVAVVHDGNRRQNLHCLIKRQAWQSLIDYFDNGGRAMHRWFAMVRTVEADFSEVPNYFLNINTMQQLTS